MRLLKLLFVFVVLALSLEAAWTPTCTSFVYVNGINTLNLDAAKTVTDSLQPQFLTYITSKGKAGSCYSIHLFYNASAWWGVDLIESARLFFNGNTDALKRFVNNNELFQTGTSTEQTALVFAITNTPKSGIVNTFALTKTALSTIDVIKRLPQSEQFTTRDLVSRLLIEINASKTAVCLGHSEGNFYCNLAYRIIAEDNSSTFQTLGVTQQGLSKLGLSLPDSRVLQIIGIAEPDSFVADGRGQYLTDCQDPITAVPKSLLPNYGTCVSSWRDSFWMGSVGATVAYWLDAIGKLILEFIINFQDHNIETYLTEWTGPQQRIMQMMEKSISDASSTTSTYTFGPNNSDDMWVTSVYYGGGLDNDELRIGGWGDWYYSLFKFNLAGMPFTATKAELRFYKFAEGGNRSQIYLDRVTSTWTESTRWSNKPLAVNLSTLPQPADNQWYMIDITNLYNGWQDGSYQNNGIMLRPSANNNTFNTFRSSEYADPVFRPQLVVSYVDPFPQSPINTQPTITLSGANPMSVNVGTQFVEPGYIATDVEDGNITAKVTVNGSVNTNTLGTYTRTYNVSDSAGLSAISQTRTVNVVASVVSGTATYALTSSLCSVVWVTSVYYGGGQHDADMRVGGWGDWYYSLLKCNQVSMPKSATKAVLRLYAYPSPSGGSRGQMYLDRITSSWDNSTKWQSRPSTTNIATLPAPVYNQWYEIDITALYNGWQSGSFANYGIMLRPFSNGNVFNFFRSPEYANAAFKPQLVVTTSTTTPLPLTGACSVNGLLNPVTLQTGNTAFFGAGSTGGTAPIHFLWTGATGGDANNAYQVYNSPGTYNVSVRLTDSASPPQQVTITCPQVTVSSPAPPPFSVSCSFNPNSILLGTNTTMVAGALGGYPPYLYQFPGDSGFNTSPLKTFAFNGIGKFNYTAYAKDSRGSIATSPSCFVTVNLGTLTATNTRATPNPVKINTSVLIQLWGSNFLSGTTQVCLTGPGCLLFGSCPIPVTVASSGYMESRTTLSNPGSYLAWLRNGSGSWILAPVLTLTVTK